ncbi:MAG: antitoxin [Nitrospinae bacterium]|nr:antitoxin [Nitrospinota bacterium]
MEEERAAKLFANGRSQAVRLPKKFQFKGNRVYIHKEGDSVVLSPRPCSWKDFFEDRQTASDDFLARREDMAPQSREVF